MTFSEHLATLGVDEKYPTRARPRAASHDLGQSGRPARPDPGPTSGSEGGGEARGVPGLPGGPGYWTIHMTLQ